MLKTATLRYWPPGLAPTDAQRQILAIRHAWVWLSIGHDTLPGFPASYDGPADFTYYRNLAADLRARGPVKVGLYVGGFDPDSHHPHFAALDDDDLLHHPDGRPVKLEPQHVPPITGERLTKLPNYGSPAVRTKLVDWWDTWMSTNGFDGICLDSYSPQAYASWAIAPYGLTQGTLEGPAHTVTWWATALWSFVRELRDKLGQSDRVVMVNGLSAGAWDTNDAVQEVWGRHGTGAADVAHQVLSEHVHLVYRSRIDLDAYIRIGELIAMRGGSAFFFFQTGMFTAMGMLRPPETQDLMRYFLTAYLLWASDRTYVGYNDKAEFLGYDPAANPVVPVIYDSPDFDLDLGRPVGPVRTNAASGYHVLYREYERAFAVLNPNEPGVVLPGFPNSPGWGRFGAPGTTYRVWSPTGPLFDSGQVGGNVPPRVGWVLMK